MIDCRRRGPKRGELHDDLLAFIAKERSADIVLIRERVYRNVVCHGQFCERLTLGHKEMYWIDATRRFCWAAFTPLCSGIRRDGGPGPDWWHEAVSPW